MSVRSKGIAAILAVSTVLGISFTPVSAQETEAYSTPTVLFSIRGQTVSRQVKNYIEENGIEISDDSLIEIIPISSQKQRSMTKNIISVTTQKGTQIEKEFLLSFQQTEDGKAEIIDVPETILSPIQPRDGHTSDTSNWNDYATIKGTAVYDLYNENGTYYYQPYGCYFFVNKKVSDADVSFVSVSYSCDGFVYTYPDFQNCDYEDEHLITVTQYNPKTSTMYSKISYYDSDKVLKTSTGSPFVGNSLTYTYTINGIRDGVTLDF